MIGLMLEVAGEPAAVRHYYAVGQEDQSRAEWAAIDAASGVGKLAMSPVGGAEPVEAIAEVPAKIAQRMGLRDGQVRALGDKWPRRWLGSIKTSVHE